MDDSDVLLLLMNVKVLVIGIGFVILVDLIMIVLKWFLDVRLWILMSRLLCSV